METAEWDQSRHKLGTGEFLKLHLLRGLFVGSGGSAEDEIGLGAQRRFIVAGEKIPVKPAREQEGDIIPRCLVQSGVQRAGKIAPAVLDHTALELHILDQLEHLEHAAVGRAHVHHKKFGRQTGGLPRPRCAEYR